MTAPTTTPATQVQRRYLARLAGPAWERGQVALAEELAAAVTDRNLTAERCSELIAAVIASKRGGAS